VLEFSSYLPEFGAAIRYPRTLVQARRYESSLRQLARTQRRLAYDPGLIRAPVAIIRGEWDSLATDADARWLFDALKASP
jgi:hypothetical protein